MKRLSFWASLIIVAVAILPWAIHGPEYWGMMMTNLDHCPQLACDFTRHYLPQAVEANTGSSKLIPGWYYPPALALYLKPFVYMADPVYWWTAFNIGSALCLGWLIARVFSRDPNLVHFTIGIALTLTSLPVWHSIKWGQISLVLCLIMCLGLNAMGRLGGILLGIAGAIKGYPLITALFPLICGEKKTLFWIVASFIAIGLMVPFSLLGMDIFLIYIYNAADASAGISSKGPGLGGQALISSLSRWFLVDSYYQPHIHPDGYALLMPLPKTAYQILVAFLIGMISIASLRALKKDGLPHALKTVIFLCWLGLAVPPGWHHYFSFLPFAMAVVWVSSELIGPKVIISIAFLIGLFPVLGVATDKMAYFDYSAMGGTTVVCLLTLGAGLWIAFVYAVKVNSQLYESSFSNVSIDRSARLEPSSSAPK